MVSNSLDPDQAQRFVGPDLGSNCLQRLSQMTKVATSGKKWIIKILKLIYFDKKYS